MASLKFAWFANLRDDFARIAAIHGPLRRSGELKTNGRHRDVWTLACERGSVELDALMTPGNPARVEIVKWTDESPPEDRQRAIATRLAAALGHWNDAGAATGEVRSHREPHPPRDPDPTCWQ